jgi:hypothetical protein
MKSNKNKLFVAICGKKIVKLHHAQAEACDYHKKRYWPLQGQWHDQPVFVCRGSKYSTPTA